MRLPLLALAASLLLSSQVRSEEITLPRTAFCQTLGQAQDIAQTDSEEGLLAASQKFADAEDCQLGAGIAVIVKVHATYPVMRPSGPKTLKVIEVDSHGLQLFIITTLDLLPPKKKDTEA
jgi:hypothetical protein